MQVDPVEQACEWMQKMMRELPAAEAKAYGQRSVPFYEERLGREAAVKIRAAALDQYRKTHWRRG